MTMTQSRTVIVAALAFITSLLAGCASPQQPPMDSKPHASRYPQSVRANAQMVLHGELIPTPYQWLEQLDAESTQQWMQEQRRFTAKKLNALNANSFVKERITELFNVVQISAPVAQHEKIFYFRNDGLQNQPSLYMQQSVDSAPIKIVDAAQLDDNGLSAITQFSVSPNGNYLAYAVTEVGHDWSSWYIKDLNSGKLLNETISGTKFTHVSWYPDSRGFYYSRYPTQGNTFNDQLPVEVFYHQLGSSPNTDIKLTPSNVPATANPYPEVTSDGKYLLLRAQNGPNFNEFYIRPLKQPTAPFEQILTTPGEHRYLGSHQGSLYFFSQHQGGTGRVISIRENHWQRQATIIEQQKLPLIDAALIDGQLITHYLQDAQSRVMTFDLSGNYLREVALPGFGTVSGFAGNANAKQTFFKFSSYTHPGNIYRYQPDSQHITLWYQSELPVNEARYQTHQVFVTVEDGTQIPVFLVQPKNRSNHDNSPLLLHAYGGFGRALTPSYRADFMAWLELGGSLAVANVRGGGEYGSAWHHAAVQENKPRAIADFLQVASWLVDNKLTSSDKLVAHGSGHGGLLVAAAMLKQPQRFAVVLANAGVYDLLRYQTANANARAWQSEFGISANASDFATLVSYSPIHTVVNNTCYPATILTTGAEDQRVAPWHSYKFAAALQHAQSCDNPVLLDIDQDAGHGDKTPLWLQLERTHRQWSFALNQLQVDWLKNSDAP